MAEEKRRRKEMRESDSGVANEEALLKAGMPREMLN